VYTIPPVLASESVLAHQSLYQLDLVLEQQTVPKDTVVIIIEPIVDMFPLPQDPFRDYVKSVIDIGILLIVDEIQTEFGRVNNGKELFAIEEREHHSYCFRLGL